FIAFYDTLVSQFFPEKLAQKAPKIRELISETSGWLPWWGWLLVLSGIIACASFEYAVRASHSHPLPGALPKDDESSAHVNKHPLNIIVGSGEPFDKLEVNDYGAHRTISVIVKNTGQTLLSNCNVYRTYISYGLKRDQIHLIV